MHLTLLDFLLNLHHQKNSSGGYTLFFTSRENGRIKERLAGSARLDIYATNSDIESYLRSRIRDPHNFEFAKEVQKDPELGDSIVRELVEKAQGMLEMLFLIKSDSDIY